MAIGFQRPQRIPDHVDILECAGKAAQANRTPSTGNTGGLCQEQGQRVLAAPCRRRFPLAVISGWELEALLNPKRRRVRAPFDNTSIRSSPADFCRYRNEVAATLQIDLR